MTHLLRLGAFDVALESVSTPHRELLEGLFRARVEPVRDGETVHLRMDLAVGRQGETFGSGVSLLCREADGRLHFVSDVIAGHLDRASTPNHLSLSINDANPHVRHLDLYLRIVLNAVFRRLDRLRLHAAAVEYAGATSMFVGDKGVGKTTTCLHLARAGGTVLGEDQIMVRRTSEGRYLVAGGDDVMRVTGKTEAHFFAGSLPAAAVEVAGVSKKEIRARDHIAYLPNSERSLERLFFPEVGQAFAIHPMARQQALGRLAGPLLPIHRFTSDDDRRDFIAFLAGVTRQAECFSLTLTPDLADLQKLSRFLE